MKHFLAAFKALFPPLAPLVEGMEKDMAEMDAEFERTVEENERKHEELRRKAAERREAMRRESDARIDELLKGRR